MYCRAAIGDRVSNIYPSTKFVITPPNFFVQIQLFLGKMSFELNVAIRASHAALLPVVLIATSINEARPTPVITINYQDTAFLNEKVIVELKAGDKSVNGTAAAIQELCAQFPFLSGKDTKLVSLISHLTSLIYSVRVISLTVTLGERVGFPG